MHSILTKARKGRGFRVLLKLWGLCLLALVSLLSACSVAIGPGKAYLDDVSDAAAYKVVAIDGEEPKRIETAKRDPESTNQSSATSALGPVKAPAGVRFVRVELKESAKALTRERNIPEQGEFSAYLQAGKTYQISLSDELGRGKVKFALLQIHSQQSESSDESQ